MLFRVLSKEVGRQVPKIAFPSRNQSQWHKKQRGLTGRKFQIKWKFLWREIHRAFRRTVAPEIRASSSSGPLASDKTIFTGYRATGAREVKPSTSIDRRRRNEPGNLGGMTVPLWRTRNEKRKLRNHGVRCFTLDWRVARFHLSSGGNPDSYLAIFSSSVRLRSMQQPFKNISVPALASSPRGASRRNLMSRETRTFLLSSERRVFYY